MKKYKCDECGKEITEDEVVKFGKEYDPEFIEFCSIDCLFKRIKYNIVNMEKQ